MTADAPDDSPDPTGPAAGTPLLLLHGVMMSAAAWDDVVPLVRERHDVIVPTALGHHGGPEGSGPFDIHRLLDETERVLDARGIERAHIAGNSMGGWMALELARRGRALSVCALSPAGFWGPEGAGRGGAAGRLRRLRLLARLTAPICGPFLGVPLVRRIAMRDIARHADRLTRAQAITATRDTARCAAAADLLATTDHVAPMPDLPCPVTLAWSERDAILPAGTYGEVARQRIPDATYLVLPGVGHVPMIDDPGLVARTILRATGAA